MYADNSARVGTVKHCWCKIQNVYNSLSTLPLVPFEPIHFLSFCLGVGTHNMDAITNK